MAEKKQQWEPINTSTALSEPLAGPVTKKETAGIIVEPKPKFAERLYKILKGVVNEVIKPALIDIAYNAICDTARRYAYPNSSVGSHKRRYYDLDDPDRYDFRADRERRRRRSAVSEHKVAKVSTYENIKLRSRSDAESVRDYMIDYSLRYRKVPVMVLYENDIIEQILIDSGYSLNNYMLDKYGWTDLNEETVKVRQEMDGSYRVELPFPDRIA